MSREAFEAWGSANGYESKTGQGMDYPLGRALWIAWQAARAAALEEAAEVCEARKIITPEWQLDQQHYNQAATHCAQAIRALKEKE